MTEARPRPGKTLAARRGELEPLAAAVDRYGGPFLHGFSLPASAESVSVK